MRRDRSWSCEERKKAGPGEGTRGAPGGAQGGEESGCFWVA